MPKLAVIMASTREERQGPAVAEWFVERARQMSGREMRFAK